MDNLPGWWWWPAIASGITTVFGMLMFIVMGVDLFPGHDGGRWITLIVLDIIFLAIGGITESGD